MRSYPITAIFLLVFLTGTSGLSGQSKIDSLDRALRQLATEGHFSGNLLLAEGGTVVFRSSYGYADFTNKVPLTTDAVLELASVSKQFTAAAVSLLVADGRITLDSSVAHYLPELAAYPTLTVRQLVHHTGGLPDYMSMVGNMEDAPEFVTNATILNVFRDSMPEAEFLPGEKFSYSNTGYLVLASLIELVSGQSFGTFLSERIFRPLGMNDTQVYQRRYEDRSVDRFTPGYVWANNEYIIPDSLENYAFVTQLDGVYGDGMVNSTVDDLFRWDRALAAGKLLDTTLLFRPALTSEGDSTNYAFGLFVKNHPDYGRMISHSGGWPGMVTFLYRFPDSDRTVILLRNDGGGDNGRLSILRNTNRAIHDLPLEFDGLRPLKIIPPTATAARELPATYVKSSDFSFQVSATADALLLDATDQNTMHLTPGDSTDRYDVVEMNAVVDFGRDATGAVEKMTLRFPSGYELVGTRTGRKEED